MNIDAVRKATFAQVRVDPVDKRGVDFGCSQMGTRNWRYLTWLEFLYLQLSQELK